MEIRDIPGFPGYRACDEGYVIGPRGGVLRGRPHGHCGSTRTRYLTVALFVRGARTEMLLHHAVLRAFGQPRPQGRECRHLDGDPGNNRLSNLAWGTHRENMQDAVRHGTLRGRWGEENPHVKVSDAAVREIRERRTRGERPLALSRGYGVNPDYIRLLCRGDFRREAGGPVSLRGKP